MAKAKTKEAAAKVDYKVIDVRMTWRKENEAKSGPDEPAEKLTAAAEDGWRLAHLYFHNLPQGDGYDDLVTAYAIMMREVR